MHDLGTHQTADQAWMACLRAALAGALVGSRDGETIEILDAQVCLQLSTCGLVTNPARKMKLSYLGAETLWYLSGSDKTFFLEDYAPTYRRFSQDPDREGDSCKKAEPYCFGAYGARVCADDGVKLASIAMGSTITTQFEAVEQILRFKPLDRRAIISIWRPSDVLYSAVGKINDVPCTTDIQFLIRAGELRMSVNMRSSDCWLGLPNDIYQFTCWQRLLADKLGVAPGPATFKMTSLHVYSRNWIKAKACVEKGDWLPQWKEGLEIWWRRNDPSHIIPYRPIHQEGKLAKETVESVRDGKNREELVWSIPLWDFHPVIHDSAVLACLPWAKGQWPFLLNSLKSPIFRNMYSNGAILC